ncbi:MAG: acyl carrier protein [Clostridia bacterium]|nr:acyl carrier protein [Clostridia bacterium]
MYEQILAILSEKLNVDPAQIREDSDIVEELDGDSIEIVEIVMALEETFSISVPDEDIASVRTPKEIFDYVAAHVKR